MLSWLISLVILLVAGFATAVIIDEVKTAATTSVIEHAFDVLFGSSRQSRGWLGSALDIFGGYSTIRSVAIREAVLRVAVVWVVAAVLVATIFYFL